jgi:protein-S-isoprenylcysteine O-methyltransferase Ste14
MGILKERIAPYFLGGAVVLLACAAFSLGMAAVQHHSPVWVLISTCFNLAAIVCIAVLLWTGQYRRKRPPPTGPG